MHVLSWTVLLRCGRDLAETWLRSGQGRRLIFLPGVVAKMAAECRDLPIRDLVSIVASLAYEGFG